MLDQLASIVFTVLIILLTVFEKNKSKSILTPFTIAAWPFVFIILLTNLLLHQLDFNFVTVRAQIFIFVNLLLIWSVGFLLFSLKPKRVMKIDENHFADVFKPIENYKFIIIIISWAIIILNFYKAGNLINHFGGYWFLADARFEILMSKDIIAHLVQVGQVCFILLVFTFKNSNSKLLYTITMTGLLLAIALIQIKYHLIWLILIAYLFRNTIKPTYKQIKSVISIGVILLLTMNMFWFFLTIVWGTFSFENKAVWEFFISHSANYMVSGPIVLDGWLEFGDIKPDWALLVVFMNIGNLIMGNNTMIDAVPLVSHGFIKVAPNLFSNVGTSYGVYYLIGGYYFTFIMVILLALISYFLYLKSYESGSQIVIFLNIFFLSLHSLNFFVQYFTLLSFYELIAIFMLFIGLFKILDYIRSMNIDRNRAEKLSIKP